MTDKSSQDKTPQAIYDLAQAWVKASAALPPELLIHVTVSEFAREVVRLHDALTAWREDFWWDNRDKINARLEAILDGRWPLEPPMIDTESTKR